MIPDRPSNWVVYICSSSQLLADKSHNAEMKIIVSKAKQIQNLQLFSLKMTTSDNFE